MTDYNVNFTRESLAAKILEPKDINQDQDITLFGRTRLSYGRDMNENLLHLLEHFSCPEDSGNPGNPDLAISITHSSALVPLLTNPIEGQLWLNSTDDTPYFWDGYVWTPLALLGDYGANSGVIIHGETLPMPVSASGYEFEASECSWIVSPANLPEMIDNFYCDTNSSAVVRMLYSIIGTATLSLGCANYLIIGIRYNTNLSILPSGITPSPTPSPTVTPSNTVTPTVTPTVTVTSTVTPTVTPTVTVTPTRTPTVTPTVTVTPTKTVTPTPTPTKTVTPTPSPV